MNDADFGKVLRKMRTDSGKTVPEVSAHLTSLGFKAATQTVYGWERGLSQPNPDPFLAMCKFYGVTDILSYFETEQSYAQKETPPTEGEGLGEDTLDKELISRLRQLTRDELAKVDAFVQGILAAR